MFFAEPERAFANLRSALKPDGRVAFSCFRTPKENALVTTLVAAVADFVPPLPKLNPEDPGPFAFADPERVKRILSAAGFKSLALEPVDVQSDISNGKGMEEALLNAMEIGPASRALRGASPETVAQARAALRTAFTPLQKDGKVLLGAGLWIVTAKNG
jgi:hypothetical protein